MLNNHALINMINNKLLLSLIYNEKFNSILITSTLPRKINDKDFFLNKVKDFIVLPLDISNLNIKIENTTEEAFNKIIDNLREIKANNRDFYLKLNENHIIDFNTWNLLQNNIAFGYIRELQLNSFNQPKLDIEVVNEVFQKTIVNTIDLKQSLVHIDLQNLVTLKKDVEDLISSDLLIKNSSFTQDNTESVIEILTNDDKDELVNFNEKEYNSIVSEIKKASSSISEIGMSSSYSDLEDNVNNLLTKLKGITMSISNICRSSASKSKESITKTRNNPNIDKKLKLTLVKLYQKSFSIQNSLAKISDNIKTLSGLIDVAENTKDKQISIENNLSDKAIVKQNDHQISDILVDPIESLNPMNLHNHH